MHSLVLHRECKSEGKSIVCALGQVTETPPFDLSISSKKVHLTLNVRVEGSLSEGKVARERVSGPKRKRESVEGAYAYEPLILIQI